MGDPVGDSRLARIQSRFAEKRLEGIVATALMWLLYAVSTWGNYCDGVRSSVVYLALTYVFAVPGVCGVLILCGRQRPVSGN